MRIIVEEIREGLCLIGKTLGFPVRITVDIGMLRGLIFGHTGTSPGERPLKGRRIIVYFCHSMHKKIPGKGITGEIWICIRSVPQKNRSHGLGSFSIQ
jgi:hypothetical protein